MTITCKCNSKFPSWETWREHAKKCMAYSDVARGGPDACGNLNHDASGNLYGRVNDSCGEGIHDDLHADVGGDQRGAGNVG